MKWFPGSINDAVTTAKQREAIFVVFVEGKDETSLEAARLLNVDEISSRMDRDEFVAVRVETDTESFNFFEQIYKIVPVPSLFFIGTNGTPMDVIAGTLTPATLSTRIDAILTEVSKKDTSSSSSNPIESERLAAGTSVERNAESSPAKDERPRDEETTSAVTPEEKLERAKQLMELQRRQKIEKEREEEKKREMERRRLGKDLQSLKQKQHEAEVKLALDERMREKAAESEARERVRRQIAQDKLERKERETALQRQMANEENESRQQQQQSSSSSSSLGNASNDATSARIQFRLPTGAPHAGKFDSTSTLGSLRSYVSTNIELPFQQFTMSTTFPRRDLSVDDDDKTLTELELVPTAVILILPVKNAKVRTVVTSSGNVGFVSRLVRALFAPVLSIYNYAMRYFGGGATAARDPRGNDASENVARPANAGPDENSPRFARMVDQSSGSIGGNLLGGSSTAIRSRGNVHRLYSGGEDNDENNTWNGNSTQQM